MTAMGGAGSEADAAAGRAAGVGSGETVRPPQAIAVSKPTAIAQP